MMCADAVRAYSCPSTCHTLCRCRTCVLAPMCLHLCHISPNGCDTSCVHRVLAHHGCSLGCTCPLHILHPTHLPLTRSMAAAHPSDPPLLMSHPMLPHPHPMRKSQQSHARVLLVLVTVQVHVAVAVAVTVTVAVAEEAAVSAVVLLCAAGCGCCHFFWLLSALCRVVPSLCSSLVEAHPSSRSISVDTPMFGLSHGSCFGCQTCCCLESRAPALATSQLVIVRTCTWCLLLPMPHGLVATAFLLLRFASCCCRFPLLRLVVVVISLLLLTSCCMPSTSCTEVSPIRALVHQPLLHG